MELNKIQIQKPTIYIPKELQKRLKNIHNYPLIILQAASGFGMDLCQYFGHRKLNFFSPHRTNTER